MVSDVIRIRDSADGREAVLTETEKAAAWCGLSPKAVLQARLIAEEMMGLILSLSGEINADFRIETSGKTMTFLLDTSMLMNETTRKELLESSTSLTNEAAKGFLGHLREYFAKAMLSGAGSYVFSDNVTDIPVTALPQPVFVDPDWDHYERSILKNLADQIRISIRGSRVELTVRRNFQSIF